MLGLLTQLDSEYLKNVHVNTASWECCKKTREERKKKTLDADISEKAYFVCVCAHVCLCVCMCI